MKIFEFIFLPTIIVYNRYKMFLLSNTNKLQLRRMVLEFNTIILGSANKLTFWNNS